MHSSLHIQLFGSIHWLSRSHIRSFTENTAFLPCLSMPSLLVHVRSQLPTVEFVLSNETVRDGTCMRPQPLGR